MGSLRAARVRVRGGIRVVSSTISASSVFPTSAGGSFAICLMSVGHGYLSGRGKSGKLE